jgi:hypothetical protein
VTKYLADRWRRTAYLAAARNDKPRLKRDESTATLSITTTRVSCSLSDEEAAARPARGGTAAYYVHPAGDSGARSTTYSGGCLVAALDAREVLER